MQNGIDIIRAPAVALAPLSKNYVEVATIKQKGTYKIPIAKLKDGKDAANEISEAIHIHAAYVLVLQLRYSLPVICL